MRMWIKIGYVNIDAIHRAVEQGCALRRKRRVVLFT